MTDGAFSDDGAFHPLETWDGDAVMKLFRERLLARWARLISKVYQADPLVCKGCGRPLKIVA